MSAAAIEGPAAGAGRRILELLADAVLDGPSLDPRAALPRAIEAIAAAAGCDVDAYLLDETRRQLVLSASTSTAAAGHAGARVPLGAGPLGRAAVSCEIAQSEDGLLCLPLAARPDRLLGVVAVHARGDDRLDDERRALVAWSTCLVARALDHAQRHAAAARLAAALQQIGKVSAVATAGLPTIRVLDAITELARGACSAEVAVMIVPDPAGADNLVLKSIGPALAAERPEAAALIRRELTALDARVRCGGAGWPAMADDANARLRPWLGVVATVPLRMAGEELGVLCCYRAGRHLLADEHQAVLATIANHAALALKAAILMEDVVEHNEFGRFLRDVVAHRLDAGMLHEHAARLGLSPTGAYAFVVGSVAVDASGDRAAREPRVLGHVAQRLGELARGTRTLAGAHEVIALVPAHRSEEWLARLRTALRDLRATLRERTGMRMTFGISRASTSLDEVREILTEAREALAIGVEVGGTGVFTLDDVSHHLLLRRAADVAPAGDRYATAIEALAEHDRVRNGALLHTLSVFLHLRSRSHAARALYVHRNTLAQRLRRIQELTRLDVTDAQEWFPLQLALEIHQLRTSRR